VRGPTGCDLRRGRCGCQAGSAAAAFPGCRATRSVALLIRGPFSTLPGRRRRGPGSALHHFVMRRVRDTRGEAIADHLTGFCAPHLICPSRYCVAGISLVTSGKSLALLRAIPCPIKRGVWPIVTNVGRGERWTRWRNDECVDRGRRSYVVLISRRRYQVCDVMMLQMTVTRKPDRRGERGVSRKPSRRECRSFRRPVVTTFVWFL